MSERVGLAFAYILIVVTFAGGLAYTNHKANQTAGTLCNSIVKVTAPVAVPTGVAALNGGLERVETRNRQLASERKSLLDELGRDEQC